MRVDREAVLRRVMFGDCGAVTGEGRLFAGSACVLLRSAEIRRDQNLKTLQSSSLSASVAVVLLLVAGERVFVT